MFLLSIIFLLFIYFILVMHTINYFCIFFLLIFFMVDPFPINFKKFNMVHQILIAGLLLLLLYFYSQSNIFIFTTSTHVFLIVTQSWLPLQYYVINYIIIGSWLKYFCSMGCIFWTLWSAFICGFFGNYLGLRAGFFATHCLFFSFLCIGGIFFISYFVDYNYFWIYNFFYCFQIPLDLLNLIFYNVNDTKNYQFCWALLFDNITLVMLFVVVCISLVVHLYAIIYMAADPHQTRFFSCLSFFTFFMLFLVTAASYMQLFIGWEGVGLCSYLLITFWYQRIQATKSALQAVIMNKFGDITLFCAILILFIMFNDTSFQHIINHSSFLFYKISIGYFSCVVGELIGILLFFAAIAKSAQIGLHTWLLSAMEGPTPVSALLHAATMVTAGIFLMLRSTVLLEYAPLTLNLMIIFGAFTAFFSATCGVVQHDIKKIIAFSTCSQLGYMFYTCGLGNFSISLYHLTNHAFFKALLFLCAGAVIHVLQGEQDLRRMGGLITVLPLTYIAMLIASLSLLGFPYLSGFYSKDMVIELAWSYYHIPGTFIFWLATLSAFLTSFYSSRLLYYIFLAMPQGYKPIYKNIQEVDSIILWAFRPLIVGSIFSGYFLKNFFLTNNNIIYLPTLLPTLTNSNLYFLDINLNFSLFLNSEFLPFFIKLIPVFFSFTGMLFALYFYKYFNFFLLIIYKINSLVINQFYTFFIKKWYFDIIYNKYIAYKLFTFGFFLYSHGDQGFLEFNGPQNIYYTLNQFKIFYSITIDLFFNLCLSFISCLLFFLFLF